MRLIVHKSNQQTYWFHTNTQQIANHMANIFVRIRQSILILCWSIFLFGCSDSTQLTRIPTDGVILAFGDSLTYGTGAKPSQSYPVVLEQLVGRKVVSSGVPGETSHAGLMRLPGELEKHEPQLVILELGANDILRRMSKEKAKNNLVQMIKMIRAADAEVLLVGVPDFGLIPDTAEFYYWIEEELNVAAENKIIAKLLKDVSMKSDAVHFNSKGYKIMAEAIRDKMQASGAL